MSSLKFRDNGGCGYLLRPDFMFTDEFDPNDRNTLSGVDPLLISINIIGARHLCRSKKGTASPLVEVEVIGATYDAGTKLTTRSVPENGFNPHWNQRCEFEVACPPFAMIRFLVQDVDVFGEKNFIGQATYPVSELVVWCRRIMYGFCNVAWLVKIGCTADF